MEMLRTRSISVLAAKDITEWPKVPQLSIKAALRIDNDQTAPEEQPNLENQIRVLQEANPPSCSDPVPSVLEESRKTRNPIEPDKPQAAESAQTQTTERTWSKIKRFTFKRPLWPNPQLSIGTKCSRMGDNECWEAIGPAQALFAQISQPIGELLDTRVEEIEEGEPVAGNILTYGMYMIGRDLNTARPTLIVTYQRPKPRRRDIKGPSKDSSRREFYRAYGFGQELPQTFVWTFFFVPGFINNDLDPKTRYYNSSIY